tara:strand:+ start:435 stop:1037 length:603 start_codon:yes stop_codon:yes gene_type:complete
MKNLITLFFIISLTSYSQDNIQQVEVVETDTQIQKFSKEIGQNELKFDFLSLLAYDSFSATYERMNDTSTAYGVSMLINFGDDNGLNDNFAMTPYYRIYFLESEDYGGYGFFAEVFSKFGFGESEDSSAVLFDSDGYSYYGIENYFDVSLGVALGRKWINRQGYSFEFLVGLGKNLLYDNDQIDRTETMGRFSASIGKRF